MKVITDEKKIEEVLTRSVGIIYPTREALKEALLSGEQMRIYIGIDPTATYAHLGHATNYMILKKFWELGHKIIVLIGDFTAMIGDPSDKTSARKRLTKEEVKHNMQTFKNQIGKILDFSDTKNPIEFRHNSEWLAKLSFEQAVDLASNFTVQQMLERDIFQKRVKEGKPLYVHEFFYPLMQGYDSVELEADIELCGTDQTFNALAGRTLVARYQNREKFVITTTLLENPRTGEKLMSKSLGTGVGIDLPPDEMFAKTMALPDEGLIQLFTDCTWIPIQEVESLKQQLEQGANPRDLKLRLAHEVVNMYHNQKMADEAQEHWTNTFSKGETPENIPEIKPRGGQLLVDILLEQKLVGSKTEFRRLVDEGAVSIDGVKVIDPQEKTKSGVVKVGKHRFLRMVI